MFTQQHYRVIAGMLLTQRPPELKHSGAMDQWRRTVQHFIEVLTGDNPKFNPTRFMEACRYTP